MSVILCKVLFQCAAISFMNFSNKYDGTSSASRWNNMALKLHYIVCVLGWFLWDVIIWDKMSSKVDVITFFIGKQSLCSFGRFGWNRNMEHIFRSSCKKQYSSQRLAVHLQGKSEMCLLYLRVNILKGLKVESDLDLYWRKSHHSVCLWYIQ